MRWANYVSRIEWLSKFREAWPRIAVHGACQLDLSDNSNIRIRPVISSTLALWSTSGLPDSPPAKRACALLTTADGIGGAETSPIPCIYPRKAVDLSFEEIISIFAAISGGAMIGYVLK